MTGRQLVSFAGLDAAHQSAVRHVYERDGESLQRAGVSPTAAALATIRERAAASTAGLVAAVKTKARQSGITMQMEALEKGVSLAIAQAGIGKQFTDSATEGYKSAAQLEQLSGSLKTGAASI